jgi:tryptophan synthase alpha chain
VAEGADGVVVGSALIDALKSTLDVEGRATPATVDGVLSRVRDVASGVRRVRKAA